MSDINLLSCYCFNDLSYQTRWKSSPGPILTIHLEMKRRRGGDEIEDRWRRRERERDSWNWRPFMSLVKRASWRHKIDVHSPSAWGEGKVESRKVGGEELLLSNKEKWSCTRFYIHLHVEVTGVKRAVRRGRQTNCASNFPSFHLIVTHLVYLFHIFLLGCHLASDMPVHGVTGSVAPFWSAYWISMPRFIWKPEQFGAPVTKRAVALTAAADSPAVYLHKPPQRNPRIVVSDAIANCGLNHSAGKVASF